MTIADSKITKAAVESIKNVIWFHALITFLLSFLLHNHVAQYAILLNLVCLCERIWAIQLQTLIYWPIVVQGVFVASRLLTVTVVILLFVSMIRVRYF